MKHYSLIILWVLLLLKLTVAAPQSAVSAELILPEDPLPFGKSAELVITLSWAEKEPFEAPKATNLEIPGATTLDRYQVDLGSDGNKHHVEYHLVFTRFEPGEFDVGPVILETAAGNLKTKALNMTFSGSQPKKDDKPGEIRAEKPVVQISTEDFWRKILSWSLASLAILLLLAALVNQFGLLDRFRSPKAKAAKSLNKLKKSNLEAKELLISCAQVLRNYLNEAYAMPTREATSVEILNLITMDNRCQSMKATSEQILDRADMIKFADRDISRSEAADLLENLLSTIREEKKVPQ